MRSLLLAAVAALCLPTLGTAQPLDSLCTYDTCALRFEPTFLGTRLVRGADGTPVASSLSAAVAASPEALAYARTYEQTRTPALLTSLAGAVLLAVAAPPSGDELIPLSDGARLGIALGSVGLSIYGIHLLVRNSTARSRALWWYNQSLVR